MAEEDWIWGMSPLFGNSITPGNIRSIVIHDEYIYAGGQVGGSGYIKKYRLSDLSYVGLKVFGALNDHPYSMVTSGDYLVVGGRNNADKKIKKYSLPDLAWVTSSPQLGSGIVEKLLIHGEYVYFFHFNWTSFYKYKLSDLSYVGTFPKREGGYALGSIAARGEYVYVGEDYQTGYLNKYKTDDMSLVDSKYIRVVAMDTDEEYLYASVALNGLVNRYDLSTFSFVDQSSLVEAAGRTQSLLVRDDYIYVAGDGGVVNVYKKSDLTHVDQSPSYGNTIYTLAADENYLYIAGNAIGKIYRWPLPFGKRIQTFTAPTQRNLIKSYTFTAPTLRHLVPPLQTFTAPTVRNLIKEYSHEAPTLRRVIKEYKHKAPTLRRLTAEQKYVAPTLRQLTKAYTYIAATLRHVVKSYITPIRVTGAIYDRRPIRIKGARFGGSGDGGGDGDE